MSVTDDGREKQALTSGPASRKISATLVSHANLRHAATVGYPTKLINWGLPFPTHLRTE